MAWKLWYSDGSTFSDYDGEWLDAPCAGAVILVSSDPQVGRELDHGTRGEFFAWWPGASKPWGFDRVGILDYLVNGLGHEGDTKLCDMTFDDFDAAGIKVGRSVDNDVFESLMLAATNDEYFETKSADTMRERVE
jgi:hypothetical protein